MTMGFTLLLYFQPKNIKLKMLFLQREGTVVFAFTCHYISFCTQVAAQWVIPREIYPEEAPEMAAVLNAMATSKIVHADIGFKGTQLKALLVLEGGQKVVFKPKRSEMTGEQHFGLTFFLNNMCDMFFLQYSCIMNWSLLVIYLHHQR